MSPTSPVDVVVVGGGIAGTAAAAALSPHCSVLVLEREPVADRHSTGRSAAALIPSYGGAAVRALTAASGPWFAEPGDATVLRPRPVMWVSGPDGAPARDALSRSLPPGTLEPLSETEARALLPALRAGWSAGALLDRAACDLDVDAVMVRLRRTCRESGATSRLGAGVRSGSRVGSGWRLLLDDGSTLDCGAVVDAAGAWGDEVARACGVAPLGLSPRRRTLAVCPVPEDPWGWPLVCDTAETFYLKPERGQVLVSPADETPTAAGDARAEESDVAAGLEAARAALDLPLRSVRRSWAGLRTFAPDRVPVLGRDAAEPTFVWCVGQGGYGVQTAPAAGEVVAAAVLGTPLPPALRTAGVRPEHLCATRPGLAGG